MARYLFDINTNYVPSVVTNWTVQEVRVTNEAGFFFVEPRKVAVIVSNAVGEVTVKPSAALESWSALAAAVGDTAAPGAGKGLLAALVGGAGLFSVNLARKLNSARAAADEIGRAHV